MVSTGMPFRFILRTVSFFSCSRPSLSPLGYGFCYAVEDMFQVPCLACVLYFDDDYFILAVFGLYVHTVELVVGTGLVSFAFQNLDDGYLFAQQHGEKAFQHAEVCLVAQQMCGGKLRNLALLMGI